jgi:hypothetical protein
MYATTFFVIHVFIMLGICCLSMDDLQAFKSHKISVRFISGIKKLANPTEWIDGGMWSSSSVSSCIEFNELPLFMKCKIKGKKKVFMGICYELQN